MTDNKMTVRKIIRELMNYNLDAEFEIIGNDGYPLSITELNIGWQNGEGEDSSDERDIFLEKHTCTKLILFPNNEGCER